MLTIIATWHATPGKGIALRTELEKMVRAVRKTEPQCIEYSLLQDSSDQALLVFYERYQDQAAFDFHRTTPHYAALKTGTADLTDRPVTVQRLALLL